VRECGQAACPDAHIGALLAGTAGADKAYHEEHEAHEGGQMLLCFVSFVVLSPNPKSKSGEFNGPLSAAPSQTLSDSTFSAGAV